MLVTVAGQRLPIVIATKPVDFRRGDDGLAVRVQNELGLDPHSGLTVVFCSRRGDRLKQRLFGKERLKDAASPQTLSVLE